MYALTSFPSRKYGVRNCMRRVTITGADDKVKLSDLEAIHEEFPFVEWGILFSTKRVGTSRYPSIRRIKRLCESGMPLSAHLCGEYARKALLDGWVQWPDSSMSGAFGRRQVNGYDPASVKQGWLSSIHPHSTILQCMSQSVFSQLTEDAKLIDGSILFDPSGGRGVLVSGWPLPPYEVPVGLAGGIGPENIQDLLGQWVDPGPNAWVDLESKARDDKDNFDVGRVRETLQEVDKCGWVGLSTV